MTAAVRRLLPTPVYKWPRGHSTDALGTRDSGSQCMRAHGIASFPDPDCSGNILVTPADHLAQGSPQFTGAADRACHHLLPNGGAPTAAQLAQLETRALKFSQCMRTHGLPTFPDPNVSAGGISVDLNGLSRDSPAFQGAQQACKTLLPGE